MRHWINTIIMAVAVSLTCVFLYDQWYFIPVLTVILIVYLTILSLGILFMQYNYFLKSKTKISSDVCLLSFDDGPDENNTLVVLDILKKYNIKAAFFVIGEKAEQHPEIVKRIQDEGHLIGNHSYAHHKFMSMFTRNKLRLDIDKAQKVLHEITGKHPTLFRPPIGYTNPNYATVLDERSMTCMGWSLRSYDSIFKHQAQLIDRLIKKIKPGQIILLHDNLKVTTIALEPFIEMAIANGIIFASADNIQHILNE